MCPDPAKPDLDFIGNAHSTTVTNVTIHFRQISRRKHDLPGDAGHAFSNKNSGALLFAPATGEETRDYIGQRAREGREKVVDAARQFRPAAEPEA